MTASRAAARACVSPLFRRHHIAYIAQGKFFLQAPARAVQPDHPGEHSMAVESIFYSASGLSCRGALVWDETIKAPRPLLLMAPNWRGVIKPAIETGQMLAGQGYIVF